MDYVTRKMLKNAFVFSEKNDLHEDDLQISITPRQNTHSTRRNVLGDHYMGTSSHSTIGELICKHPRLTANHVLRVSGNTA